MRVKKYYDNEDGVEPPYQDSEISLKEAMNLLEVSKSEKFALEMAGSNSLKLVKLITSKFRTPPVFVHHIIEINGDTRSIQTLTDNW